MKCPHAIHGDPTMCSMCLGASPTIISRDTDGMLLVDGRRVDRGPMKSQYSRGIKLSFPKGKKRRAQPAARDDDDVTDVVAEFDEIDR